MDLNILEQFSKNKGRDIAGVLFEKYNFAAFEADSLEIEREIYDVAISYSKILFFEAKKILQESVRDDVRTHLTSRFENKDILKMKDVDLIAHWIKLEVIRSLEGRDIFMQ